jgi:hypothetical protein
MNWMETGFGSELFPVRMVKWGESMTTPANSTSLPPLLLARDQEAQVAADEANARKAAADADTSALTLAQTKYKSLVPDLTGVATNTVDDKSTGVAFSGLVTYSALNHATEIIASRISAVLGNTAQATILVTSQSDLLTSDLLSRAVASSLHHLVEFAEKVLAEPDSSGNGSTARTPTATFHIETLITGALAGGIGIAAATAAGAAGLGPLGLGAAAAAAVPSIISLFSSTTTVKDHTEDLSDLAATTSVVAAVAEKLNGCTVAHEDFRLAPETSRIRAAYQRLAEKRTALVFKQERVQKAKTEADLDLARAEQQQDAAKKAKPPQPDDPSLAEQVRVATAASATAAAEVALISGAITSIDAFTTAVNATAAGTRSPLAIASLNELLHHDGDDSGEDIGYVLSVKGLGGQSEEYRKDRQIGVDTYTTLADASVSFMLYDVAARKIISSGIANGVSSVHGRLGHPPTGLRGPNADDAIDDQYVPPAAGDPAPPPPPESWWRRIF